MTSLNRRDETCVFYFSVSGGTSATQTNKREVPESRDKNLSEGFASETITFCSFIHVQSHVSLLIYIQCTYMLNLEAVILLDTLHFESDTLLPLVEIEHRSDLWQWLLRVQHRVVHV